ncbi:MAG TPA: alanine--tRNA ligase-related protein [Anaerolineae bacterium]|nr:alanine--tRNA ligase-related protein [Anaerolineae bacterium]
MHTFDVGQRFIRHYQAADYQILPRGSLLDPATPMTFVGSAGLTQIETGIEQYQDHSGERYVLVQPCFRHFDIEKVGDSPVHLSLFEMGGAFAFGHIAREETLGKLWSFLVDDLGLEPGQLWVTNFVGGILDTHRLDPDVPTLNSWQKLGVRSTQILDVGVEAGFWRQGDGLNGHECLHKCGPTTEIFFDRGRELCCSDDCRPGCACGRFIEIANVLFIHDYIDQAANIISPLFTPFDETVIGVERLAMAVQGRSSVYELDCFTPVVQFLATYPRAAANLTEATIYAQCCIIADHIRALLFLTADGAPPPGKGGRARIMRQLVRDIMTSQKVFGITDAGFSVDLIDTALRLYEGTNPHLTSGRERLLQYFQLEIERFERTLQTGYRQLNHFVRQDPNGGLGGIQALALVKQYGFPLPLLEATLAAEGIPFDRQGYCKAYAAWLQTTES